MEGARSVEIAGDWDGWLLHPLTSPETDIWVGALAPPRGQWRFVLRVDGTDWVVPGGVAIEPEGRGRGRGLVGLMLVR